MDWPGPFARTDSRLNPDTLRRFVRAYQRVQPLTIGELWAVAITLRTVLVENLRRLAEGIVRGRASRQAADALADELLGVRGAPSKSATTVLQTFEDARLTTAFAVQFVQRLRDQGPRRRPRSSGSTSAWPRKGRRKGLATATSANPLVVHGCGGWI
jgi:cyclic beta-1,2-glucan synthetase